MDRSPADRRGKGGPGLFEFRLRRADNVAPARVTKQAKLAALDMPGRQSSAGPVGRPRLLAAASGGKVRESKCSRNILAQRKPVEGHDERDQNLLAIRPVIAGMAALRLWVGQRLTLKIDARDIVK